MNEKSNAFVEQGKLNKNCIDNVNTAISDVYDDQFGLVFYLI